MRRFKMRRVKIRRFKMRTVKVGRSPAKENKHLVETCCLLVHNLSVYFSD